MEDTRVGHPYRLGDLPPGSRFALLYSPMMGKIAIFTVIDLPASITALLATSTSKLDEVLASALRACSTISHDTVLVFSHSANSLVLMNKTQNVIGVM